MVQRKGVEESWYKVEIHGRVYRRNRILLRITCEQPDNNNDNNNNNNNNSIYLYTII